MSASVRRQIESRAARRILNFFYGIVSQAEYLNNVTCSGLDALEADLVVLLPPTVGARTRLKYSGPRENVGSL